MRSCAALCLLLVAACPRPGPPTDGGLDPPPAADSGADASVDAGGPDAGDAGDPEVDAGPPLTANQLVLTTSISGAATTSLTFTNAVADAGQRCFVDRRGSCLVVDCSGTAPLELVSAGELRVVRDGGVAISAWPDDAGLYPTTNRGGPWWAVGDELLVSASGAVVPRFSVRVGAPPRVVVVSLLERDGGLPLLVRDRDFVVHWVALDAGVGVVVTQSGSGGGVMGARRLLCDFDGNRALGVLPAAALSALEATKPTAISVGGLVVRDLAPGGYRLRVQVTTTTAWRADVADPP